MAFVQTVVYQLYLKESLLRILSANPDNKNRKRFVTLNNNPS